MFNLENKKVIITGATGGIGDAITKSFVDNKAKVLATGTNEDKLNKLSNTYKNILTLRFDISKHEEIEKFLDDASNILSRNFAFRIGEVMASINPDKVNQEANESAFYNRFRKIIDRENVIIQYKI